MLLGAALAAAEDGREMNGWITGAHAAFTLIGVTVAVLLLSGLWNSRHLPFQADIGALLAHRGVGDYTLSMSHFFDLTGPSFAALRLPAALAALALAVGPALAWLLRRRGSPDASTVMIAVTAGIFLVAAHLALDRFASMLSSEALARTFMQDEAGGRIEADSELMLYGDQAYGSSLPFYTGRILPLVEGRSTSMWFGSTFADAPPIFLTNADLLAHWGTGPRKVLFVPEEKRAAVDALLGPRAVPLAELSGKALITDRPVLP